MELSNKNVVVLGLGSSGMAAARLLLTQGANVTIRDNGNSPSLQEKAAELRQWTVDEDYPAFKIELGGDVQQSAAFDLAVISPGIDPALPLVTSLLENKVPVIGELELGYRFTKCPIIAITGTNGKTTTTELIRDVFQAAGKRAAMGGNIGTPLCDLVEWTDDLEVMIIEVSSFQLEHIVEFRPHVSIHLNLTPDHLDRYPNMEAYRDAKWHIFRNQMECDLAIVNETVKIPNDVPGTNFPPVNAQILRIAVNDPASSALYYARGNQLYAGGEPVLDQSETRLIGPHNAENILATIVVADHFKLPRAETLGALKAYHPLPHRCELVRELDGVKYINDSKATNNDALEKAVMAISTPIILIAGGKDKGLEFDYLRPLLTKKVAAAVLIGKMTAKLTAAWTGAVPCHPADSLAHAVELARDLAKPGYTVLLSPGCSSFDMFKSYEDRGDQFRELVLNQRDAGPI